MQSIKLTVEQGKVKVISPYNQEFVSRARNLRGKWEGGAWIFDEIMIEHVRALVMDCFSVSGEGEYEECILCVTNFSDSVLGGPVELFDRTIAYAYNRDSGAKLSDNVFLISGHIGSGGSVKNWRTHVTDAHLEIHNFPLARTEKEDVQKAVEDGWCEIKLLTKNEESSPVTNKDLASILEKTVLPGLQDKESNDLILEAIKRLRNA